MIYRKAEYYAAEGYVSKAYQSLQQSRKMVPLGEASYKILDSKFVVEDNILNEGITPEMFESIRNASVPDADMNINKDQLLNHIYSLSDVVSPGSDQFSHKMIKQLVGRDKNVKDASENEFIDSLVRFISRLAGGRLPQYVYDFMRDTEVIGIPKGDTPTDEDLRTIAKPLTFRKLMFAPMLKETEAEVKDLFRDQQYAFERDGTAKIIHSIKYALESDDRLNGFSLDGANAFNSANRVRAFLQLLAALDRKWLPGVHSIYGSNSNNWYRGLPTYIKECIGEVGAQQGCTIGPLLYTLSVHELFSAMNDILRRGQDKGFMKSFVDDNQGVAHFEDLMDQLRFVIAEGPKFGYILNLKKCKIMLGYCDDTAEALERRDRLVEMGILKDNIALHPQNTGESDKYGLKILGSYVGHDDYINSNLEKKMVDLRGESQKLVDFIDHNPQVGTVLFVKCFSKKVQHLYRTISPSLINADFNNQWNEICNNCFHAACGSPGGSDDEMARAWSQFRLKMDNGGHGIGFAEDVAVAAFVASNIEFFEAFNGARGNVADICGNLPQMFLDITCGHGIIRQVQQAAALIHEVDNTKLLEVISQMRSSFERSLQGQLTDCFSINRLRSFKEDLLEIQSPDKVARISWFDNQQDSDGNLWIEAIPKRHNNANKMSKKEFNAAMCFKYFLPQPSIATHCRCACGIFPDAYGHHLAGGCRTGKDRHETHDSLNYLVRGIAQYAGIHTIAEPLHVFANVDEHTGMRPDAIMKNPPPLLSRNGRDVLIDVSVTSTFPNTQRGSLPVLGNGARSSSMTLAQAQNRGSSSQVRCNEKNTKYRALSNEAGLEFIPLVFESCGRMHSCVKDFVSNCCKVASENRNIPHKVLTKFWLRNLAFRLQHQLSKSIVKKSFGMRLPNAANGGAQAHIHQDDLVLDYERVVTMIGGRN